jgi:prefoldin subunit 5
MQEEIGRLRRELEAIETDITRLEAVILQATEASSNISSAKEVLSL